MFRKLMDAATLTQIDDSYTSVRPVIRMARALLCLDCESIFEAEGTQTCPACGSTIAWAIGRSLNRSTAGGAEQEESEATRH